MTDRPSTDHPSLVNVEAVLASQADCTPHLGLLLRHFGDRACWFSVAGTIYFRPPPSVDDTHTVYVLQPLHVFDPLPPDDEP